jgi:hypothetical protein
LLPLPCRVQLCGDRRSRVRFPDRHEVAEASQGLRSDPADLDELLDGADPTARRSQLENLPGSHRADAGQLLEDLGAGSVEIDRKQIDDDRPGRIRSCTGRPRRHCAVHPPPRDRADHDAERDEEQNVALLGRHRVRPFSRAAPLVLDSGIGGRWGALDEQQRENFLQRKELPQTAKEAAKG